MSEPGPKKKSAMKKMKRALGLGGSGKSRINGTTAASGAGSDHASPDADDESASLAPSTANSVDPPLSAMDNLAEIARLVQSNVEIRDRTYKFKTYRDCFVGSEAVDFLVENGLAADRGEAVQIGQCVLSDVGAFRHVTGEHTFMDEYMFYHVIEPQEVFRRVSPMEADVASGAGGGDGSTATHQNSSTGAASAEKIVRMDKYGFLLGEDDDPSTSTSQSSPLRGVHRSGDAKRWTDILDRVPKASAGGGSSYATTQSKVKYYARRGLPDGLRKRAWTVLTGVDLVMQERAGEYDMLVSRAETEHRMLTDGDFAGQDLSGTFSGVTTHKAVNVLDTIERDIHRTFPKHYLFHKVHPDDEVPDNKPKAADNAKAPAAEVEGAKDEPPERQGPADPDGEYDSDCDVDDSERDPPDSPGSMGPEPLNVDVMRDIAEKRERFSRSIAEAKGESDSDIGGDARRSIMDSEASGASNRSLDLLGEEDEADDATPRKEFEESRRSTLSETPGMGHGQAALRRVLFAYSMYDSEVGYCQGMNFITAMFLTFLSEEESFWLLVGEFIVSSLDCAVEPKHPAQHVLVSRLIPAVFVIVIVTVSSVGAVTMNEEPYKLRELFGEDMAGTHEVLYIAEKLMTQFLPKLSKHLEKESIHVSMFVTQWLLTVYTSTFPFDLVARVWDSFLVEGWKVVYRVMLALLESAQADILALSFENILGYLKDFPSTVDGPAVMAGSLRINLKRKHIQKHVNEWRRHSGDGDGAGAPGFRRKDSGAGASSVSSGTLNSDSVQKHMPKFSAPKFGGVSLKKAAPKEIIIEDLSHDLLPIVGNKKFAVLLHNVLSPDECAEMIDRAEEAGFHDASIYDRRTNQAHRNCTRHISDDSGLADNWFERIMHALKDRPALEYKLRSASFASNKNDKLNHAVGINERLRLLRYRQGEFFHSHNDTKFIRGADQGERAGETSYVSVIIYLNHKFKGGTTRFHGNGRQLDVKPRTGSILVHEHNILHSGQRITSGKKYIVRTDVMYSTTVMSGRFGPDGAMGTSPYEEL